MNKKAPIYWFAVISLKDSFANKLCFSCLSFYAVNRYMAEKEILKLLPDNPDLLDPRTGELFPYHILELEKIAQEDLNMKMEETMWKLQQLSNNDDKLN